MKATQKKWYDDWEAGTRLDKKTGKMVYYFKLPYSRSDCTMTEFTEGDKNVVKLKRLHNFAESALTELSKINWCKMDEHEMRAINDMYGWRCQRCGFTIGSFTMRQLVDKELITDKDRE